MSNHKMRTLGSSFRLAVAVAFVFGGAALGLAGCGANLSPVLNVAHANGTFVAFSRAETAAERACFVSGDQGDTWMPCAALVKSSMSFMHDGQQWVAPVMGGYATSSDANTWTMHSASNVPSDLLFDGTTWFGRSGSSVYRGASLDSFARVATNVPSYRSWIIGRGIGD